MIKGKALLVITKLDSKYVPFDVQVYIQSCNGNEMHSDIAYENFMLLETNTLPLPNIAYQLEIGETARVSVVYEFVFTCDYFGEHDVDIMYHKERTLRIQYPRNHYVAKSTIEE